MPEICRKNRFFGIFSRFHNFFSWFFAQRCVLGMFKTWPSPIFGKKFFRLKMPEICRISPFLQIFTGLFPYISLFFRTKTLLISMPTILKHISFVNKTDFCSWNFLKVAGTADFRRKTLFLEFLELNFIFFHEIWHTDAKW